VNAHIYTYIGEQITKSKTETYGITTGQKHLETQCKSIGDRVRNSPGTRRVRHWPAYSSNHKENHSRIQAREAQKYGQVTM